MTFGTCNFKLTSVQISIITGKQNSKMTDKMVLYICPNLWYSGDYIVRQPAPCMSGVKVHITVMFGSLRMQSLSRSLNFWMTAQKRSCQLSQPKLHLKPHTDRLNERISIQIKLAKINFKERISLFVACHIFWRTLCLFAFEYLISKLVFFWNEKYMKKIIIAWAAVYYITTLK